MSSSRALPPVWQTALGNFSRATKHAGSLGLSWTTYGYLARHLLTSLPLEKSQEQTEAEKQLTTSGENCKCIYCRRGRECIFAPFEAPWTYFYRIRHDWFPQTVQLFSTGAHIFTVYGLEHRRRTENSSAVVSHMYALAAFGGSLAGLVVAKHATMWVNDGGLRVVLCKAKRYAAQYVPGLTRALRAGITVAHEDALRQNKVGDYIVSEIKLGKSPDVGPPITVTVARPVPAKSKRSSRRTKSFPMVRFETELKRQVEEAERRVFI